MTITSTLLIHLAHSQTSKFSLKAGKQTVRELSRKTPDSLGANLLTVSTALRAYRNRHLGTLMRCCEAWEPVGECFGQISLECIDFQRLSQIIANLTRENLVEREAEITNHPWTQTEKDNALARCRVEQRVWCAKKPMLYLHAVTDDDGHLLENEYESGRRLCEWWGPFFRARAEGPLACMVFFAAGCIFAFSAS